MLGTVPRAVGCFVEVGLSIDALFALLVEAAALTAVAVSMAVAAAAQAALGLSH